MKKGNKIQSAAQIVKEIKRRTHRTFSSDEKIKIVLEGMTNGIKQINGKPCHPQT